MQLKIESVHLGAVAVIKQELFKDQRGFFTEVFREDQFKEMGLPHHFVQDNHSGSVKGVTRGLHFQWEPPMGKLMRVTKGEAFLVAVDIRKGSPTLGRWFGKIANEDDKIQIWAPANFARGFCVLSDYAEIQYKVSGMYNSRSESGIRWNDPEIGIEWPVKNPILSEKDTNARTLNEWLNSAESDYFIYDPNQDIK
jgi:dTDP-4-dehydrorhamnose 3,5-epimerase